MTHGDWYRMRAAEFQAKANEEEAYLARAELERLSHNLSDRTAI